MGTTRGANKSWLRAWAKRRVGEKAAAKRRVSEVLSSSILTLMYIITEINEITEIRVRVRVEVRVRVRVAGYFGNYIHPSYTAPAPVRT